LEGGTAAGAGADPGRRTLRRVAHASEDEPMISAFVQALRFPGVAFRHKDVLGAFVRRELKSRYEGSLLGRLWPVLQPLVMLAVYALVFSFMLGMTYATSKSLVADGWAVTFFMLSGILPWIAFAEGVNRGTTVVVENGNLIKKIAFPSELLPTQVVLVAVVQLLIGLALMVPLYVVVVLAASPAPMAERVTAVLHVLWLPVPLVLQIVFTAGVAMLLGAFNVFVRDVGSFLPLAMMIWNFLTPVFYRVELVEHNAPPWVAAAMRANPMYHLCALWRGVFCVEKETAYPLESAAIFGAIALCVFVLGLGLFRRWKGLFADEV
jgi:lipopolysaccharide transport system permease protein